MLRWYISSSLLLSLGGCGDNERPFCLHGHEVQLQVLMTSPSSQPDPQVRARVDGLSWFEPEVESSNTSGVVYGVCPDETYSIFVACEFSGLNSVLEVNATAAELSVPRADCRDGFDDHSAFDVSGEMRQPGAVAIEYTTALHQRSDWSFEIPVTAPGRYDVVAVSDAKIAIQRGLQIDGPSQLSAIDLDQIGQDLVFRDLVVDGATPETTFSTGTEMETAGRTYISFGGTARAQFVVPPPNLLLAGDAFSFGLVAEDREPSGYEHRDFSTANPKFSDPIELLPRLSPALVTLTPDPAINVADLPAIPYASIELNLNQLYSVTSSPGWLAAMNATVVRFDIPPDLDPGLLPNSVFTERVSMFVSNEDGAGRSTSVTRPLSAAISRSPGSSFRWPGTRVGGIDGL